MARRKGKGHDGNGRGKGKEEVPSSVSDSEAGVDLGVYSTPTRTPVLLSEYVDNAHTAAIVRPRMEAIPSQVIPNPRSTDPPAPIDTTVGLVAPFVSSDISSAEIATDLSFDVMSLEFNACKSPISLVSAPSGQKSWRDVIKKKDQIGMALHTHSECCNSTEISVSMSDLHDGLKKWENTLMGNVLGAKPTEGHMIDFANKNWKHLGLPKIQYFKNAWFSFRFKSAEEVTAILKGGPWKLGNNNLILKPWTPLFSQEMDRLSIVLAWVLFHDLDPFMWTEPVLSKMATTIGTPMCADLNTTNQERLSFARVLIDVDVSATLPTKIIVNNPIHGKTIQSIEYEWLPYYCTSCKKLRHRKNTCKWEKKQSVPKIIKPKVVKSKPVKHVYQPTGRRVQVSKANTEVDFIDDVSLNQKEPNVGNMVTPGKVIDSASDSNEKRGFVTVSRKGNKHSTNRSQTDKGIHVITKATKIELVTHVQKQLQMANHFSPLPEIPENQSGVDVHEQSNPVTIDVDKEIDPGDALKSTAGLVAYVSSEPSQ